MSYKVFLSAILLITISATSVFAQGKLLSSKKLKKQKVYTNLEEALKTPEKVYRLDLDGSKQEAVILKSFPNDIYKFTNLQELNLSNNEIAEFPVDLTKLVNLQILDLSFNPIKAIPTDIKEFTNLRVIKFTFCKLDTVPLELFSISTLEQVDLFANHIIRFPEGIKVNTTITYLNIQRNGMSIEVKDSLKSLFPNAGFGEKLKPQN